MLIANIPLSSATGLRTTAPVRTRTQVTEQRKSLAWLSKVDIQIWTAVIGIFGTFIASPLAVQIFNQSRLPVITDQRRATLQGRWEGMGTQIITTKEDQRKLNVESSTFDFPAHLNLSVSGRRIHGTLDILKLTYGQDSAKSRYHAIQPKPLAPLVEKHEEVSYDLEGHMLASNFIRLDYVSSDPGVVEFGTLLLKIPSAGGKLYGNFVSYGPVTEGLVSGEYEFTQTR